MKVYKERWVDGKLVVGEETAAPPPEASPIVNKWMEVYGIKDKAELRPKLFNRVDATITDISGS